MRPKYIDTGSSSSIPLLFGHKPHSGKSLNKKRRKFTDEFRSADITVRQEQRSFQAKESLYSLNISQM